jgi:predicted alpha/beta-fold hydrolase
MQEQSTDPADDQFRLQGIFFFRNGHVQSIYPTIFRKVKDVLYQRERIDTPDQDFLDLDWSVAGGDGLAVISHGLEGNSYRAYVKGMVRAMNQAGIDALAALGVVDDPRARDDIAPAVFVRTAAQEGFYS